MAKALKISPMGALKIARRLEKENILKSKKLGKATYYNLNFKNDYVMQYIEFLLKREAEQSSSYVKRWVNELRNPIIASPFPFHLGRLVFAAPPLPNDVRVRRAARRGSWQWRPAPSQSNTPSRLPRPRCRLVGTGTCFDSLCRYTPRVLT